MQSLDRAHTLVQCDRTQHGRVRSYKLSSGEIQLPRDICSEQFHGSCLISQLPEHLPNLFPQHPLQKAQPNPLSSELRRLPKDIFLLQWIYEVFYFCLEVHDRFTFTWIFLCGSEHQENELSGTQKKRIKSKSLRLVKQSNSCFLQEHCKGPIFHRRHAIPSKQKFKITLVIFF